ncbi:MAG: M23 family metallopeptidase [Oscillospiraceae bacterium]
MARFPMQRIAITAGYGPYTVNGVRRPHYGCDICSQTNTNVVACHAGRVVLSCYDGAGGNMLAIAGYFNERADIITRYAHLASRRAAFGEMVDEGQIIGIQGASGSACFGQHLHLETWLVPKDYSYNYNGRIAHSVDPLSVLHVVAGQTFVKDADTLWKDGIPYPEPHPSDIEELPQGAYVKVLDGSVRLRLVPYLAFTPLTAGAADRSCDTLGEFCGEDNFAALYHCKTKSGEESNSWAMIDTRLGPFWVALIDGMTELCGVIPQANTVPTDDLELRLANCKAAIGEAVALLSPHIVA